MKLPYLVFVGDGPLRKKMEKYIADNKLERVVITGFKNQSEIPKMYSIADIFVLPSEFDPSPKVINEAMNFSLPIIVTTGVGTAEDLVLKNECGLRYPIGDVETLTQYFKKLIKDEGFCTKLGRNSYQTVTKLWNAKEDVKGLISALEYIKKSRT